MNQESRIRNKGRWVRLILQSIILYSLFLIPFAAFAQQPPGLPSPAEVGLRGTAELPGQAGLALPSADIRVIAAKILRVAFGFLGTVALALILYGGYLWMTALGDEEKITKAKRVLTNAVVGLAIILSALAITQFILGRLLADRGAPPLPPPSAAPARVGGGALGSGIVESHFPMRGATGVPRNTRIIVTFKQPIDPASLAELVPEAPADTLIVSEGPDGLARYPTLSVDHDGNQETAPIPVSALRLKRRDGAPSAIQIIKTDDIEGEVRESSGEDYLGSDDSGVDVLVAFTGDLRTLVFTPVQRSVRTRRALFGSATEDVSYTVYLCGAASDRENCDAGGIKLRSGQSAFAGHFKDYQWSFEVGTFVDVTPPKIASVIPLPDNTPDVLVGNCSGTSHGAPCDRPDRPRNTMVQVNFNEAVLPTVASGSTLVTPGSRPTLGPEIQPGTYAVMRVIADSEFVAGNWQIGNQYRTSEFVSADLCGRNSCGEDVFCLPKTSEIAGQVLAATLAQAGDPASAGLFDGIEDIAGNSLDGNSDGAAQGPGTGAEYLASATFHNMNVPPPAPPASIPGDNARFSFFTSGDILLGAPLIEKTAPLTTQGVPTAGVPLATSSVEMTFDRSMAMTTFKSPNVLLSGIDTVTGGIWDTWWTTEGENLPDTRPLAEAYGRSLGRIRHGGFWEETDYVNQVTSKVRDLYQNCYYPGAGKGIVPGDQSCAPDAEKPYCCNGVSCAAGEVNCQKCGFN